MTDAAILSTMVDGTVLVVRAFKTPKELAQHALRASPTSARNMAGVVLNAVNLSRDEYKYSYQYYYRRDGYYAADSRAGALGSLHPGGPPGPDTHASA